MSRRSTFASTLVAFAFIFVSAVSGCSTASNPAPTLHSADTGIQESPQSLGSWTTKADMPTGRYNLAVGVDHGIAYAVGGDDTINVLNTLEAYDPATNSWTTKASMPTARYGLAVGVIHGIFYAVGGVADSGFSSALEAYDPATNSWTTKAPMPTARGGLAVGVINGI